MTRETVARDTPHSRASSSTRMQTAVGLEALPKSPNCNPAFKVMLYH
jgi:hypothetical protein